MSAKYLIFYSRDELVRVNPETIAYFEADGNYTNIIQFNKLKAQVSCSLAKIEQMIESCYDTPHPVFCRIGKSYIININHVYKINQLKQQLILSDGRSFAFQLNVSQGALKALKEFYRVKKD